MQQLHDEMTEDLASWTDGMKDGGDIAGSMLEWLQGILITARIHCLRIPLHGVEVLFPHFPMLVELQELGA